MRDLRQYVVPGRATGSLVGLVGVLLALPTLVLPVQKVRDNGAVPSAPGAPAFEQSYWSWGRAVDSTPGVDAARELNHFEIHNTAGLVVLVIALAVGLAGAAVHAFRAGSAGIVLGAAGLAWAASAVVGGLVRRLADAIFGAFGEEQVAIETLPVGVLEMVSAGLLVAALGLVVWRPLVALVRPVVDAEGVATAATVTRADVAPAVRPSVSAGPVVGFSDASDVTDDRGSGPDPERFRRSR